MLIKLNRNLYYWTYRTKFKIYFNTYNVTDMTDKASKSVLKAKISGCEWDCTDRKQTLDDSDNAKYNKTYRKIQ